MNGHAARARGPRPSLQVESMVLLTAVFLMLAANGPFWHAALAGRAWREFSTWRFAAAMFVAFSAFYFAFGALFANRYTVKPLLTVVLVVTAAASYYMDRYGVYFDRTMLRNVLATDYREASELIGWGPAAHLLIFGVLPATLLVWWPVVKPRPLVRAFVVRLVWIVLAVGLGAGSLMLVLADFASLVRNHREVRYLLTPGNIVSVAHGQRLGAQGWRGAAQGAGRSRCETGRGLDDQEPADAVRAGGRRNGAGPELLAERL